MGNGAVFANEAGVSEPVDKNDVDKTISAIAGAGEKAFVIGEIKEGEKGVTLV